ncbi:MAG: tyrosine-type recombinase/integrase [Firmicutes bacterium]|nr:tyrosine-type recombinase/integrase [Bacillota bacterium]
MIKRRRRSPGEGSITQRKDGRFQGSVLLGYDPKTGKPKRKYVYGKTKKEVREKTNKLAVKVQAGTYREPSLITIEEWFISWLNDYMKISLRPTTWDNYKCQVEGHIIPALGRLKLSKLQTRHIQRLYNEKLKSGRLDSKPGGLSPKSIRLMHTVIHSCLEQARKEGIIMINPASAVKLPKNKQRKIRYLDSEEIKIFLKAAQGSKHFAAFFLALNTGMRRGEILGLRWQDIDFKEETLTVKYGLVRVGGKGLVLQEPKTRLSNRTIGLSPTVIRVLKEHRKEQNEAKLSLGRAYNKDLDLVFPNEIGEPTCPRAFTRVFERLLKRAGIRKACFHDLRHTFATMALEQGVNVKTVQEALGHHSAAFTMDVYASTTDKMKREAAEKVGGLLASFIS